MAGLLELVAQHSALSIPDTALTAHSKVLYPCTLPSCQDSATRSHSWSKEDLFPLAEQQAGSYLYAKHSQKWRLKINSPVRTQYSITQTGGCSSNAQQHTVPVALSSLSAQDQVLLGIMSTLAAQSLASKGVPGCGSFVASEVRSIARVVTW